MDHIMATDWIHNAYPEQALGGGEEPINGNVNWLQIMDDEQNLEREMQSEVDEANKMKKAQNVKEIPRKCSCGGSGQSQQQQQREKTEMPLIEHLCERYKCSTKELEVLFQNLKSRRQILQHMRFNVRLRTNYLRPSNRNFVVQCNDLSSLSASEAFAMRGYLGITVQTYFYVKHGVRLRHPNLPFTFKVLKRPLNKTEFLAIAQNGVNVEWNPRRFHAIIMRLRYIRRTVAALIFQSGRVVLTGVQHPDRAKKEAKRVLRRLRASLRCANIETTLLLLILRVVNIVGSHTFTHRIHITHLVPIMHSSTSFCSVHYDPTIFPALRSSEKSWNSIAESVDRKARDNNFQWPSTHEKGTWAAVAATGEESRAKAQTGANARDVEQQHQQVVVMARGGAISNGDGARAKAEATGGAKSVVETRITEHHGEERLAAATAVIHREERREERRRKIRVRHRGRQQGGEERQRGEGHRQSRPNERHNDNFHSSLQLNLPPNRMDGSEHEERMHHSRDGLMGQPNNQQMRKRIQRECFCTC
ncbi:hypothetical protein niasHT_002683 [Heterodera trifolii]|uniref:Uncharacterized protein n=1 Tax=Heterodera trifolii TaxID=157864 RepID=A0ABD2MDW9_9BILA